MRKIEERYYFAYGSNMNLEQMKYRCPAAEVVENVRLEDYRLAFRGRAPGNGVATVLPEHLCAERSSYIQTLLSPHHPDFLHELILSHKNLEILHKNPDSSHTLL